MSTRLGMVTLVAASARLSATTAAQRVGDLFSGAADTLLRLALNGHRRRQTERVLFALSDAALKDIGIHRSEIRSLADALLAGSTVQGSCAR